MSKDDLGDRIKNSYEEVETKRKFLPLLPIYARIDGRGFSKFTHGMNKPYDVVMSNAMIETTKFLVDRTQAKIGFVQSDEISLVWYQEKYDSEMFFDGKIMKLTSVLAGLATSFFTTYVQNNFDDKYKNRYPHFDCRVFQLPNLIEAVNVFQWRQSDSVKNSVSMAARSFYSHKELQNKSSSEMQEMIFQKGMNFNDYPTFFKSGTWLRKESFQTFLTEDELSKIPEKNKPTGPIIRNKIVELHMPKLSCISNRIGVIFNGEQPILKESV